MFPIRHAFQLNGFGFVTLLSRPPIATHLSSLCFSCDPNLQNLVLRDIILHRIQVNQRSSSSSALYLDFRSYWNFSQRSRCLTNIAEKAMDRMSSTLQLRQGTTLICKPSRKFVASEYSFKVRCGGQAPKREEVVTKKWCLRSFGAGDDEEARSLREGREMNCGRRRVLAVMAWPLLIKHSVTLGRQVGSDVEVTEDPVEMAVVAVLDARDMIPALSTYFLQAKSKFGPSTDCKSRHKDLTLLYNRLKINLPRLVQELEINEESSDQLLQGLALVEEDMCSLSTVSSGFIGNSSISRVNVEGSLKSLKLARSKVDVLLLQVPNQLLELAQLARGVRPTA